MLPLQLNKWPNIWLFLHSLEGFVLDLLKPILTEIILVIKKAHARAYLPGLYKIFLLYLFDPTPGFCLDLEIWEALRKESKSIKLKAK